jgi:N-acetylglucosaminyldiphosphoundecaprenol N-acetyl-beta-D-mannosaminyltransferase
MDMPIDAITKAEAVAHVFDDLASGCGGTVITPNIEILRQYMSSPELQSVFERTDLLVADGMPLVVALRLQGTPVPEQITGTDLLLAVCAEAAVRGYSVLLAGGRPGDAARAADVLSQRFAKLRVQTYPCFVRPDTETRELAELCRIVVAASPDVVFLGLPFGTQVRAMALLRENLPATWFLGVGSSFELVNGDRSRPPRWVQRLCMEWAWRLTRQPQLWRRYLIDGMPIAARVGIVALRARWHRRASPSPNTSVPAEEARTP